MHAVWGRVPATALVMNYFPKANYFLYMDSDAILALPNYTPTTMYQTLAYDGYGKNATFQHRKPGLIVNKPLTGWLCLQCAKLELGRGCFNSGTLLWRRSKAAQYVLKAWWESRLYNTNQNFLYPNGEYFLGWSDPNIVDTQQKMGEQNRLMYAYATNPAVRQAVWPVPRQISHQNYTSCPQLVDAGHTPCLQNDYAGQPFLPDWNSKEPSCFVNHFAIDKSHMLKMLDMILGRQHR